jgi:hypothetical protein
VFGGGDDAFGRLRHQVLQRAQVEHVTEPDDDEVVDLRLDLAEQMRGDDNRSSAVSQTLEQRSDLEAGPRGMSPRPAPHDTRRRIPVSRRQGRAWPTPTLLSIRGFSTTNRADRRCGVGKDDGSVVCVTADGRSSATGTTRPSCRMARRAMEGALPHRRYGLIKATDDAQSASPTAAQPSPPVAGSGSWGAIDVSLRAPSTGRTWMDAGRPALEPGPLERWHRQPAHRIDTRRGAVRRSLVFTDPNRRISMGAGRVPHPPVARRHHPAERGRSTCTCPCTGPPLARWSTADVGREPHS